MGRIIEKDNFICIYHEGHSDTDIDNYRDDKFNAPEIKRFSSLEDLRKWVSKQELKSSTDIRHNNHKPDGYLFEKIYIGKEEFGEFFEN